jgi:LacI family transcriptional regulator
VSTIKIVASSAGVSVATVSRVVNGTGVVRPELRERVERAMAEMKYHPSALARGLRRQETLTVGILVPKLDHPFFGALAFAIERALFASGYRSFMCSAEENLERELEYVSMLLDQRVDGVIIVPTGRDAAGVRKLRDRAVAVVTVDRDPPGLGADSVSIDNFGGARALASHLLELGHRRIGIASPPESSEPGGLRLEPSMIVSGTLEQFEMGYSAGTDLLSRKTRPTAIMALTDVMALGVMRAAFDAGLRVPDDVSVTGFDDIPLAAQVIPGFTTVAQPIYAMGERAAELLLRRIQTPDAPLEILRLPTTLQIRGSSAPPAKPVSSRANSSQRLSRRRTT